MYRRYCPLLSMDLQTFFDREWRHKWLDFATNKLKIPHRNIGDNPNLTIEMIRRFKDELDWISVTENSAFTMKDIDDNPDLPWSLLGCCNNPNLTLNYIKTHVKRDRLGSMYWDCVSMNPAITMQIIERNVHLPWNCEYISANPNLIISFIRKYPNNKWNWHFISANENITMQMIMDNRDLPWEFCWNKSKSKFDI